MTVGGDFFFIVFTYVLVRDMTIETVALTVVSKST